MSETVWMMDSEFCCKCGCILAYFESVLCTFCYEEQWKQEERDFYDNWDYMARDEENDVSPGASQVV